jgi:hypothetical protein
MGDWIEFWHYTAADWAGLQFLVLAVAAIVALIQASEARRLREAQAEPFVVVDFDADEDFLILVISNIGTTMAENVRLTFKPELRSSWDDKDALTPLRDTRAFKEGISSLAPGKRFRAYFDSLFERSSDVLPDAYHVSIAFDAPALKKRLTREVALDLGIYRNLNLVTRSRA